MKNYYEILGLPDFSDIESIKKQFRKLAVMYHPDKNPEGEEKFREIAEAYEILSDSEKKHKYDARLRYQLNFKEKKFYAHTKKSPYKEKNPVYIKEALRRKYYEQHYKKKTHNGHHENAKKVSNEFRNILVAVPLTVILFLWLISFFEKNRMNNKPKPDINEKKENKSYILSGKDSGKHSRYYGKKMYLDFFKKYSKSTEDTLSFEISNQLEQDMIVLLFEQKKHQLITGVYLPSFHSVFMEDIPGMQGIIKIHLGENYNNLLNKLENNKILGGFEEQRKFYQLKKKFSDIPKKWIIDEYELSKMEEITLNDFFKAQ